MPIVFLHVMNPMVELALTEVDFKLGTIHMGKGMISEWFGANNCRHWEPSRCTQTLGRRNGKALVWTRSMGDLWPHQITLALDFTFLRPQKV